MTIRDALEDAVIKFSRAGSGHADKCMESPVLEAELLLAHVLGVERWRLRSEHLRHLDLSQRRSFFSLVDRRIRGEPSAYLLGVKEFWSRTFCVSSHTLIPRPETELLVETALYIAENGDLPLPAGHYSMPCPMILDAGTGSGVLAVTLAIEIPGAMVIALDLSFSALEVALHNIHSFDVQNHVLPVQSDWCSCLADMPFFDLVISNPPYVSRHEKAFLERDVLDYEPAHALFAHDNGMQAIVHLLEQVPLVLKPGGWFLCEIGFMQGEDVRQIVQADSMFDHVEIRQDLAGRDRMLMARTTMT